MSKHYSYLISSAFIQGIFTGFYIKTGINADPISVGKQVIEILAPMVSERWTFQVDVIRFSIDLLGWILLIPIGIGIIMVGWKKGLVAFFGIFIVMILLVTGI